MFHDFKELLSIFNAQKVKYLIIEGRAVSFHAALDCFALIVHNGQNGRYIPWVKGVFYGHRGKDQENSGDANYPK